MFGQVNGEGIVPRHASVAYAGQALQREWDGAFTGPPDLSGRNDLGREIDSHTFDDGVTSSVAGRRGDDIGPRLKPGWLVHGKLTKPVYGASVLVSTGGQRGPAISLHA